MGWRGRPARSGRRPADRNFREQRCEKAVVIGSNCRSHSVRRVAGRHRPVARSTQNWILKHALRYDIRATACKMFITPGPFRGPTSWKLKTPQSSATFHSPN